MGEGFYVEVSRSVSLTGRILAVPVGTIGTRDLG